nr:succinate dehydrogenase, cytochrome b556 subunit [uncultured Albidiferax sp.]
MSSNIRSRHEHRNISIVQLIPYMKRFPASAWVSLLHRVSGAVMFLLLPLIIWAFDASVSSEVSYAKLTQVFDTGVGLLPGGSIKLLALVILWAFLHHLIAGVRFLILDVNHASVEKKRSAYSARGVLVSSVALTALLGAKIFGLY